MKPLSLDRIGSIGALVAAIAAPCCFPLFAAVGTAAGLTTLGRYEGLILYIFQGFAVLTVAGLAVSFREHRNLAEITRARGILPRAYRGQTQPDFGGRVPIFVPILARW